MPKLTRIDSFTTYAEPKGLLRVLRNDIKVADAFDHRLEKTPPTKQYKAIWDTGATGTCITRKVATSLSLRPHSLTKVIGVHGEKDCRVFLVSIFLPNNVIFQSIRVTECESLSSESDILIGMDIITRGDFAVTNKDNWTKFSFRVPSMRHIDFVRDKDIESPKIGRNSPCPCGSGKKYKKCCGR